MNVLDKALVEKWYALNHAPTMEVAGMDPVITMIGLTMDPMEIQTMEAIGAMEDQFIEG